MSSEDLKEPCDYCGDYKKPEEVCKNGCGSHLDFVEPDEEIDEASICLEIWILLHGNGPY